MADLSGENRDGSHLEQDNVLRSFLEYHTFVGADSGPRETPFAEFNEAVLKNRCMLLPKMPRNNKRTSKLQMSSTRPWSPHL